MLLAVAGLLLLAAGAPGTDPAVPPRPVSVFTTYGPSDAGFFTTFPPLRG